MPELTPCPLMEPPKLMEMPRRCGGKRIIDYGPVWKGRDNPDARIVCTKCGARTKLDSKGEI